MWLTPEQLKKEKNDRSARKREAVDTCTEAEIIASFVHNRPTDLKNLSFERHYPENRREAPIITVNKEISENVVEIGEEVNCLDDGFDFAVAIVDTLTGATEYKPARLYSFESKYTEDVEKLVGARKNHTKPIDYRSSFDITSDKWAEKRRQLTHNFGSSKKIKMDEAAQRRTIKQETLDEMKKTAFASNSNVKEEDVKLEDITMMQKTVSSVLPPAVQADLSKDIYPLSIFLSEDEIESVADEALELMEKKRSEKLEAGILEPVLLVMYNEKTRQRAAAYLLLATMVEILQKLGKSKSLLRKELNDLKLPNLFRQKVQADYFNESTADRGFGGRGAERVKLNASDFDRFVAYTLALALTLAPEHKVPLSPFQTLFGMPPSKLEKVFQALGADIIRLDVTTAQQLKSLRGAVLLKPPSMEMKTPKRLKRR